MSKKWFADNSLSIGRTPLVRLNRVVGNTHATVLAKIEGRNPAYSVKCRIGAAAIPNSNGSVGYRIDFASVPQNRVNELPIGFCRNGSPRFEFYRDAELLPQGYRWHG